MTLTEERAVDGIAAALLGAGIDADAGRRRRAEYSSDASNYRVVPQVVAFPRSVDEAVGIVDVARDLGVPVTPRGGGTSVAGNAIGPGIVVDFSRHLNRVHSIDPDARTAVVDPGVVLGSLQAAAAPLGLRFGPDPSTWARATLGGMIGNNACGPRALAFGRTADNVISLDVVDGRGRRFTAGSGLDPVAGLDELVRSNMALLRTELGTFGRQISGYSLEHLLPEHGRNLARALVGTEGSCVTVLGATVRLVDIPHDPLLIVLGYDDMATAADAVPGLLPHRPVAIEGMDARLVELVRTHRGEAAVPDLPAAGGWLLVEMGDRAPGDAADRAARLAADAMTSRVRILSGAEARAVWRLREDGAGIAGRTPQGRQAWPGLEDAAVPPERLGAYLRDFDRLLDSYGIDGLPYGHFGDGCVHVRLDIPLDRDGSVLRSFMMDASALIASHGGSLSGEHGDGRARGELLPSMYSPQMLEVFGRFKGLLDPDDLMNPGVIVRPAPVDVDLRRPAASPITAATGFAFLHDDGDLTRAAHRCVGVGKCRADSSDSHGFMCPSFQASRDEKDSTRGRARVLQEVANGSLVHGFDSPELAESLDLCLSCKACSSDCPAGVDLAMLKSESLHRRYRGKLRPASHYSLGWLPLWARLVAPFAKLANLSLAVPGVERLILWAGGMDSRRTVPRFRPARLGQLRRRTSSSRPRKQVVLWVDSFSVGFGEEVIAAAVELLDRAGVDVVLPDGQACCGLTWISTGQLDGARRRLGGLLDTLYPYAERGMPILALEPSCAATVRSDLRELLPDDPRVSAVSSSVVTLAELLSSNRFPEISMSWRRPDLSGLSVVHQVHCHQHAVIGSSLDSALLASLGASVTAVDTCCGLAGNFGMERGHFDTSKAVAELSLLPALRDAPEGSVFLADGISCRTQADQLAGVGGVHLAQLLVGSV